SAAAKGSWPSEGRPGDDDSGPTGTPLHGAPAARGVAATAAPLEAPITGGANGGPVSEPVQDGADTTAPLADRPSVRSRRGASRPAGSPGTDAPAGGPADGSPPPAARADSPPVETDGDRTETDSAEGERPARNRDRGSRNRGDRDNGDRAARDGGDRGNGDRAARDGSPRDGSPREGNGRDGNGRDGSGRGPDRGDRNDSRGGRPDNRNDRPGGNPNDEDDDDFESGRGRRGRRYRDRNKRGGVPAGRERYDQNEPTVSEDDVLLPVAGILDVLDNYAFVRTSGYLTGPNDVYVSLSQVRRYGLRRGDAITGAVKQPRDGERKDKYNALVRLDTVNGLDPEQARNLPEFTKLTPLYPQERLRLETEPHQLTTRVIDLVMPIGKGQRALIVSPPKAGKTMVLQALANAITTNNPECHLMVVLVDERPEEVTDMQRSVKGEVIASTFDRPPSDHTTVAELSIERAKRLVEMGHDVVVLLDSITRLG
ncbi:MAG: transcription termination factor Rho, partial [Actinomycetes bacterium]